MRVLVKAVTMLHLKAVTLKQRNFCFYFLRKSWDLDPDSNSVPDLDLDPDSNREIIK